MRYWSNYAIDQNHRPFVNQFTNGFKRMYTKTAHLSVDHAAAAEIATNLRRSRLSLDHRCGCDIIRRQLDCIFWPAKLHVLT